MIYKIVDKALKKVGNRFDLVLLVSNKARQIQLYSKNFINKGKDKFIYKAFKEIYLEYK